MSSSWLSPKPQGKGKARLFCFPYAGGGVGSFLPWQAQLAGEVEVCAIQMPGRGARFMESQARSFTDLVSQMVAVLRQHADMPFWLLGHSLGALTAFEVARSIAKDRVPLCGLIVSGCEAPHMRKVRKPLHALNDDALIEALRELNGTPEAVLQDRELMHLLLPAIRTDFAFFENYQYVPGPRLTVPLTVLAGLDDTHVDASRVEDWKDLTQKETALHWLPGNHFFIDSQRDLLLKLLSPLFATPLASRSFS